MLLSAQRALSVERKKTAPAERAALDFNQEEVQKRWQTFQDPNPM
jgi:hypothetical protein